MTWPQSSTNFPYGTYTVEAISTVQNGLSKTIDVKFSSTSETVNVPVGRIVNTLVFAPETAVADNPFRIFVQVTNDGNSVHGYGTLGLPSAASYGIIVGTKDEKDAIALYKSLLGLKAIAKS